MDYQKLIAIKMHELIFLIFCSYIYVILSTSELTTTHMDNMNLHTVEKKILMDIFIIYNCSVYSKVMLSNQRFRKIIPDGSVDHFVNIYCHGLQQQSLDYE